jgi:hypothetical protein
MRGWSRILFAALVAFVATTGPAWAQATLTGVVKDTSGAVLPGVTVEASSPVLIEKARSAVSDGTGRYQIIDLRPGSYEVTFSLTGFSTVKRSEVALSGTLTTTVDAELRVGNVSETVTVSGETPVVDIQTTTRQTVMDQKIVAAIPTSRNSFAVGTLIPGVTVSDGFNSFSDVGGALGPTTLALMAHGSRVSDQRLLVNGVALSTMIGGGWGGGAVPNATGTSEFAIDTSGVDATAATGGVRINFIPRDGGNRFSGTFAGAYATEGFASDNYTGTDLPARGLSAPGKIKVNGDFNPGLGGPLVRDKLWFFLSGRYQAADLFVPGMFYNQNANNPNAFTYVADPSRQAIAPRRFQVYQGRLTLQANPKNKFGVTYDLESNCFCPDNVSATRSPDAGTDRRFPLQRFVQVDWTSPVSSKILIEASAIHRVERWGGMHLQTGDGGNVTSLDPRMVGVVDDATGLTYRAAAQGLAPGSPPYNNSWNKNLHYRASLSYIPGAHVIKIGFNNAWGYFDNNPYTNTLPYFYHFLSGVPNSITIQAAPYVEKVEVDRDLGFFVQDKWTTSRWTLSGGIRFDQFKNSFPEQTLGPTLFTPNRNVSFPTIENLNWKDIAPKLGATWDIFGNGKTALKVTLNKYLLGYGTLGLGENQISSAPNPIERLVNNTTRSWTDNGANGGRAGDFIPQCNLLNFNANGECGPTDNPNFGTITPGTSYDPDLLNGWGKRQYNWEFSLGVQRELMPRVSIDVSYFRRWYGNFQTMDDRAVSPADYTRFTFKAPSDSRLPGGGGYTQTGFDLQPTNWFLPQNNFVTLADNFGNQTEHWNGVDVNVTARPSANFVIQGGVSSGRKVTDDCEVVAKLPETLHSFFSSNTRLPFFPARTLEDCHADDGFITQMKGLAAYTIPKIDVQIAGTYQSLPGIVIQSNYLAFDTGTLGRAYATFLPFRTFQMVQAGELYGERMQQLDFRIAKLFKFGTTRTSINFDFYNILNSNTVLSENFTYSPFPPNPWRTPQSILQARFFKIGAQFDF